MLITASEGTLTARTTGYPTCPVSQLSLLLFLSAGKYKNVQAIQDDPLTLCPTPDILFAIRALAKFTFDGSGYQSQPVTMESSMTEADFSGKNLYAAGAIMLAAFLPKCQ